MTKISKLGLFISLVMTSAANAQPGATPPIDSTDNPDIQPPGETAVVDDVAPPPTVTIHKPANDPLATTRTIGFGVRATGLSGIGALPGVNYGGELAAMIRHNELFAELAVARWKPEKTYMVSEANNNVELGLNTWTVRAGWAGMKMPLRAWFLTEAGELASARKMAGVVPRMVMGDTPVDHRWKAVGAGFGVAWPMTDSARLFGMVEFAVPVSRNTVTLDGYGTYEPDPLTARSSVGLEVGWR